MGGKKHWLLVLEDSSDHAWGHLKRKVKTEGCDHDIIKRFEDNARYQCQFIKTE